MTGLWRRIYLWLIACGSDCMLGTVGDCVLCRRFTCAKCSDVHGVDDRALHASELCCDCYRVEQCEEGVERWSGGHG